MTAQPADLYELLKKIRYDATAIQAKVTDALNILGQLNIPDRPAATCPTCGVRLAGQRTLAEHIHVSHGGPIPDHWRAADMLAASEPESVSSDSASSEKKGAG